MSLSETPALLEAYREYLEGQYDVSEDLVVFDRFTVPLDQDLDSPALLEFGDFT